MFLAIGLFRALLQALVLDTHALPADPQVANHRISTHTLARGWHGVRRSEPTTVT